MVLRIGAALFAALLLAAAPAQAWLFGRDKVTSRWADKPVPVNGDDSDWKESDAYEDDGMGVQAMNDAQYLYLLVTAHTREGRERLTGAAGRDVALWFYSADGKSRDWCARLPFSRRAPLTEALRDPAGVDPEPEYAFWRGASISTGAWPSDVTNRLSTSGRRPVWELKIPLSRLAVKADRTLPADLYVAAPAVRSARTSKAGPDSADWLGAVNFTLLLRLAPPPGAGH